MRIWLDTDIGSDVDDALALAYVLARPELELVGISTVFGDLSIRGRITEALLEAAEVDGVPVLAGLGVPLSDHRIGIMFGHEGRGVIDDAEPVLRLRTEPMAQQRIEGLASSIAEVGPDLVVAIGPLTNLGALASAGVSLPPLAVMGGRFSDGPVAASTGEDTEWNWHCDPQAVRHVLTADRAQPALILPAEVTFQTRLAEGDIDRLDGTSPLNDLIATLCREWLRAQVELWDIEDPRVSLHDPLTAAVLVEPGLCTYRDMRAEVDDRGVPSEVDGPPDLRVATGVDADAARVHILETLLGNTGVGRSTP